LIGSIATVREVMAVTFIANSAGVVEVLVMEMNLASVNADFVISGLNLSPSDY
jgi:hypothetical protein